MKRYSIFVALLATLGLSACNPYYPDRHHHEWDHHDHMHDKLPPRVHRDRNW